MLNLKNQKWLEITADEYTHFCQSPRVRYSLTMNNGWLSAVSALLDIHVRYFGCYRHEKLIAAVPTWGKYIAGDRRYLKKHNKEHELDFGRPAMILPTTPQELIKLPFSVNGLVDAQNLTNTSNRGEYWARVRCVKTDISKKRRRNMNRSIRSVMSKGVTFVDLANYSAQEFAEIYGTLHSMRWGKQPRGHERMVEYAHATKPWLYGHVMCADGQPIAVELAFKSESPQLSYVEYVNAGYHPDFSELSPGSLVSYMNIRTHTEAAQALGKEVFGSFGGYQDDYRKLWCQPIPAHYVRAPFHHRLMLSCKNT